MITVNLGVFNLLPIPALDGGRIVFLIIEAIRGKPIKPEHEGLVHFISFIVLILLLLLVTFNDIKKFF
jgi:regulator of sigma E protease